jgi:glutathione peroxidase
MHGVFILRTFTPLLAALLGLGSAVAATSVPPVPAGCPPHLQHTFLRLQDEKPQSLCQYAGKVAVVVNTASYCGFTSQYQGLESLYSKYRNKGLVVLGFPSNDFSQEPGANQDIAQFCENTYGVKFPMFAKTSVTGRLAAPFYKQMAAQSGQTPLWNFHKYILGRDGRVVASFGSMTGPEDRAFIREIEKQLAVN